MAAFEVGEEGGEAGGCCCWKEGGFVRWGGEKVEEGGEEEAGGFLFWGEAEELGVEGDNFLFFFQTFANEGGFKGELPNCEENVVEELEADAETGVCGCADTAAAVVEGRVAVSRYPNCRAEDFDERLYSLLALVPEHFAGLLRSQQRGIFLYGYVL